MEMTVYIHEKGRE